MHKTHAYSIDMLQSIKYFEMDYYGGSHTFTWLADLTGLRLDLLNFIICQMTALFLASLYRSVLHPSKVSSNVRHIIALILGLCCGYFCFGPQAIHIAGLPTLCYVVIRTQNPQVVQRYVMVVSMTYLLSIHLVRVFYDHETEALDITAPLMIITQKVTSLAFSIHDGFVKPAKELTKAQEYHAVRKMPSTLEYFSYVLHFHGLLAGPFVFYSDYIDFMEGTNLLKYSGQNTNKNISPLVMEPSPIKTVIKKVVSSLMCALIFIKFSKLYPVKTMKEKHFVENDTVLYKLWYAMMSTTFVRFKYYHAWLMADAICNNSGLGFTGYDKDGNATWDLISNINILGFEFATNMRDAINNWNCGTNRWLRSIVYERVPKKYGTILTFTLSAVWHGFYPGYYLTFATGALMVTSARVARRLIRHRFQQTQFTRMFYDILTCLTTRIVMGYTTFPFVILEFMGSVKLYLKFFLCLHILALTTIYILPRFIKGEQRSEHNVHATQAATSDRLLSSVSTTESGNDYNVTLNTNEINEKILIQNDLNVVDFKAHNNYEINNMEHQHQFQQQQQQQQQPTLQLNKSSFDLKHRAVSEARDIIRVKHDQCEMDQLSTKLMEKIEAETKNIEEFIDKTVTETVSGIVEFKRDLMRDCEFSNNLRKRTNILPAANNADNSTGNIMTGKPSSDESAAFLKKEIEAINAVVQQANVLPAVLSNGHAK